tara:strand:- start:6839 stop:7363 length:525 start_codon:yes stop_codon:yes gene_type:complete
MGSLPRKRRVHLRLSQGIYDRLDSGDGSVQEQIRQAINQFLSKTERGSYREVVLSPRGNVAVDQMMSWLASRAPRLEELQANNGKLSNAIRKPMEKCLSDVQMRRVTRWIYGEKLSVIGREEGVSKQAIHASIQRSLKTLGEDHDFIAGLCHTFPDSGLTPDSLVQAYAELNHE